MERGTEAQTCYMGASPFAPLKTNTLSNIPKWKVTTFHGSCDVFVIFQHRVKYDTKILNLVCARKYYSL